MSSVPTSSVSNKAKGCRNEVSDRVPLCGLATSITLGARNVGCFLEDLVGVAWPEGSLEGWVSSIKASELLVDLRNPFGRSGEATAISGGTLNLNSSLLLYGPLDTMIHVLSEFFIH